MKTKLKICIMAILCGCLWTGCSTTRNLPEEEVLYTGIEEIDYGLAAKKKAKKKRKKQQAEEGVITSFADAYKAVDKLLSERDLSALKRKEELTE